MLRALSRATPLGRLSFLSGSRLFSALPEHVVVPMPALSPTMETGSVSNWLIKEGDRFEAGQAICEVETDKATVTYDATDDGYLARILVGNGEIEVGTPLMITVEDESDVASFKDYSINTEILHSESSRDELSSSAITKPVTSSVPVTDGGLEGRVIASPFARQLARDAQVDISRVAAFGTGSGPGGRLIGVDVLQAVSSGNLLGSNDLPKGMNEVSSSHLSIPSVIVQENIGSGDSITVQSAFVESVSSKMSALFSRSKKEVPHYYLSVEIDISNILSLRDTLISDTDITVQDILVKAAAKSMEKVPAANGSWMDSCVRQYDQVDINVIVGEGSSLQAPVLRNVGAMGLSRISRQIREACDDLESTNSPSLEPGTFSIHNLGMYGVKAAAAIVLPHQACALSLGAILDTVVPNTTAKAGEDAWKVAPMMVATLSCDHRVIDGAVGAGWLKEFKSYAENPMTLLL